MVLLEEYYELQEAENVSVFWKSAQIGSYVLAAGCGIVCGYILAVLRVTFDNKCFLFGKIHEDSGGELRILQNEYSYDYSVWSKNVACDYCQYSMVSSFIFATIWAAFFLMCGKGGKCTTGLPQPWRITLPALIFNFIYFVISVVAALQIYQGTNVFCESENDFVNDLRLHNCVILKLYKKTKFNTTLILLDLAIKSAWMTALSWFIAFLIPLLRILLVSDFTLYKISVYGVDDMKNYNEEILNVTDYDDKRHVHFDFFQKNNHPHDD